MLGWIEIGVRADVDKAINEFTYCCLQFIKSIYNQLFYENSKLRNNIWIGSWMIIKSDFNIGLRQNWDEIGL